MILNFNEIKKRLKQLVKRSKSMIVVYQIADNYRTKICFSLGKLETFSGNTHYRKSLPESLAYIDSVFNDYLMYSGITVSSLEDKRILEIGPGDNFGVALRFLAAGAKQIICLDKYYSKRNERKQNLIYQAIRQKLETNSRIRFDNAIDLSDGIKLNPEKINYIYGIGIEEADKILEPQSFDIILSRAVIEHIYDIDTAFVVMDKLLAPEGYILHKIDFRDHGMFSDGGLHPLTFLTIPDSVYRLMISDSGKPNRKLINYYEKKISELGYSSKLFITRVVGQEGEILPHKEKIELNSDYDESTISLINEIRPSILNEFKGISNEQLMISGIFLVAKKS